MKDVTAEAEGWRLVEESHVGCNWNMSRLVKRWRSDSSLNNSIGCKWFPCDINRENCSCTLNLRAAPGLQEADCLVVVTGLSCSILAHNIDYQSYGDASILLIEVRDYVGGNVKISKRWILIGREDRFFWDYHS